MFQIQLMTPSVSNNSDKPRPNSTSLNYIDNLRNLVEEINKEANSCYYKAMNRSEIDVSCKNNTLYKRDFKPLLEKIETYIRENTKVAISKEECHSSMVMNGFFNQNCEAFRKLTKEINPLVEKMSNGYFLGYRVWPKQPCCKYQQMFAGKHIQRLYLSVTISLLITR